MAKNVFGRNKSEKPSAKKNQVNPSHMPYKRSVNLMAVGQKPIDKKVALPAIIAIIIVAALIGKFAVVDRLMAASEAQGRVDSMQAELAEGYETIKSYGDVADKYAHYTYEDMTAEELSQTDRMKILQLVDDEILSHLNISSWAISENQIQVVVVGSTLQRINEIVQDVEKQSMVDYCSVEKAATGELAEVQTSGRVTAQITIYFKPGSVSAGSTSEGNTAESTAGAVAADENSEEGE
ncbi:MAG: hypothetical protein Q4E84_04185 [Clostridia bacterium]|nr:hypothetical protein [Clostridia bacterium]